MLEYFKNLFNKPEADNEPVIIQSDEVHFTLKIGSLTIGYLNIEEEKWVFKYANEFKTQNKYHRLVGFPDLDKTYRSPVLWPFFKVRIPGLGQPMIKEILQKEKIDKNNEAALLKRFGKRSISNPYVLEAV